MPILSVQGIQPGDKVRTIKGKGILKYRIFADKVYTVEDVSLQKNNLRIKGFWVHCERFELEQSTGGILDIHVNTPVGAQNWGDLKPCSCDITQLMKDEGCICGAISKEQKKYNKSLGSGRFLVTNSVNTY